MKLKVSKITIPKITLLDIFTLIILVCCIDIPYLNMTVPYIGALSYIRYVLIFLLWVLIFASNHRVSYPIIIISLLFGLVIYSTYAAGNNVEQAVGMLSRPYLICLFLDAAKTKKNKILIIWSVFLFFLVLFDTFSMFKWRDGLYRTALYKENWFLGFKTQRLVYSLPLCIFTSYLSLTRKGKIDTWTYLMVLLSAFGLLYTQATGAFLSVLLLWILLLSFDVSSRIHISKEFLYNFFGYKVVLPVYAFVVFSTMTIQNNPWIQKIIVEYIHKNVTLTGRTEIWRKCFQLFQTSPWIGVGHMSSEQYSSFTGITTATNAHNMIFTLLLSSGIIGLVLYFINYIYVTKGDKKEVSNKDLILLAGIIVMFFIGITSSTLVYSVFAFAFFEILSLDKPIKERKKRYVGR